MKKRVKVFLDANILFCAARSSSGGSASIINLAKAKKIKAIISNKVLKETDKNLRLKEPLKVLLKHYTNLKEADLKIVIISKKQAKIYEKIINKKDSFILAAAQKVKAEFLITLDKKHFFTSKIKKAKLPFKILNPEKFIKNHL